MNRAMLVLLSLLAVLGGLVGYWIYQPKAAPGIVRGYLVGDKPMPGVSEPTSTALYKWQDKQGRWHVGDTPPENLPYETLKYRHDVNVLPSGQTEP